MKATTGAKRPRTMESRVRPTGYLRCLVILLRGPIVPRGGEVSRPQECMRLAADQESGREPEPLRERRLGGPPDPAATFAQGGEMITTGRARTGAAWGIFVAVCMIVT